MREHRIRTLFIALLGAIALVGVCVALVMSYQGRGGSGGEAAIQLPDQEIVSIQIDGFKFYESGSTVKNFEDFAESLEATTPVNSRNVQRGDTFHAVTLTFEDQTKETFFFFQCDSDDGAWYLEDCNGTIFQNAEFISDYITVESVDLSGGTLQLPDENSLYQFIQTRLRLESMGISYSDSDLRAAFAMTMQNKLLQYDSESAALEATRDELMWDMAQYEYAVNHGYAPTEEELEQYSEKIDTVMRSTTNFDELEKSFEAQNTSYASHRSYMRESDRIFLAIEKLENAVYEEFRLGNDKIGDQICENAGEYWTNYLLNIIYPETEDYVNEVVLPLLDEAEAFYLDCFAIVRW